jgi:hypothetical protein
MRTAVALTIPLLLCAVATSAGAAPATQTGNAPFCLKSPTGGVQCSFATMGECEQARGGVGQCITRSDAGGTTGLGNTPNIPPGAAVEQPRPTER